MTVTAIRAEPRPLLVLPLPHGTALCLQCAWVDDSGTEAPDRATAHTHETSHPTVAALPSGEGTE